MRKQSYKWKAMILLALAMAWMCVLGAAAGEGSNDNSLADLGILTEGAEVFPEFEYGVTEYDVRVPAGTTQLELDPVPTNGNARVVDITGTELTDGEATVEITVEAENGERYPYYLHVTEVGSQTAAAETEPVPQTEPVTETEPETEDPRYVKVDRTALQEAENTIGALKDETRSYRDRSTMLMRLLYGMIAFSVVLLFIVINLLLKKKDLKAELQEYMGYGYPQEEPQEDYYERQPQQAQRGYYAGQQQPQSQQGHYAGQQPQGQQGYYAGQQQPQEPQLQVYRPEPLVRQDDPETVPRPQKAKKKPKKMPEYQQQQQQEISPRQKKDKKTENVEITMIDL